jgi:hypothetical protein
MEVIDQVNASAGGIHDWSQRNEKKTKISFPVESGMIPQAVQPTA